MGYKSIDSVLGWRLMPAAKAVLLAIAHRRNDVTGQCNPGLDDLASISCLGRRTVIRQLHALEESGALRIVRKSGVPNQYEPVPYVVTGDNLAPVPTATVTRANHDMDPCQPRHQPVPKLGTRIEEEDEEQEKTIDAIPDDFRFDLFWSIYDRKVGKPAALKLWKKLPLPVRGKILDVLPAYVKSTPDPKYRKHPATYLRGEHWEDEVAEAEPEYGTPEYWNWHAARMVP